MCYGFKQSPQKHPQQVEKSMSGVLMYLLTTNSGFPIPLSLQKMFKIIMIMITVIRSPVVERSSSEKNHLVFYSSTFI